MAEKEKISDFTVYLDGHEGHQGNVLLHAYLQKVSRLIIVLNRMERVYIDAPTRRTNFEIIGADKRNPTTLTLKPVPRVVAYDPNPAFRWAISQLSTIARGEQPDERVRGDIAQDLIKLASKEKENEDGYKAFWINGHAQAVRFDDQFLVNAQRIARERSMIDAPTKWHEGVSLGSVIGELKAVDDLDGGREFVIVPPTGAESIKCTFPEGMKDEIGSLLFKKVRVTGALHYRDSSPFPYLVDARDDGIEIYPLTPRRRSLLEMRGVFADFAKPDVDWDGLING